LCVQPPWRGACGPTWCPRSSPPPRPTSPALSPYTTLFRSSPFKVGDIPHPPPSLHPRPPDFKGMRTGSISFLRRSARASAGTPRSEEHTSELQSREKLVCRLLLETEKGHGAGRARRRDRPG